jgi:hypothetical protein
LVRLRGRLRSQIAVGVVTVPRRPGSIGAGIGIRAGYNLNLRIGGANEARQRIIGECALPRATLRHRNQIIK